MFNKTILITGGTGSWGYALVYKLLELNPAEIRIFSRNEALQVEMKQHFRDARLKFIIGDIRNKDELMIASKGVDYIYHTAALKHVPICEQQPDMAFKINVIGTQHVIDAAIENQISKVIYVSTDKASNPSNTYGMTKALGERLIIHANEKSTATKFISVRSGNVLGSTGSVIPIFKRQIEQNLDVTITDMRMTRFFIALEEAVDMLLTATDHGYGGEIFVSKMPACKIIDIAKVLMEQQGKPDLHLIETGVRPGETLHEMLISECESETSMHFNEKYFVILPNFPIAGLQKHYERFERVSFDKYDSEHMLMSKGETEKMLRSGGFL
ncbi:polysaccharide biosynthesis protein [Paenibacillus arenosi]|uniref:Polysaccharide biosynthesis protein n=1 Tax=Paenibacillus arenosi TaxID=2774142 RepID=A0ABR9AYW3_9BACL|nr:polysaccharide biosynthesis protein [Paenibacillus arenosi]MBD8499344.1 polysaccharide biosynthesis protein [Paenibacillus arenosi]